MNFICVFLVSLFFSAIDAIVSRVNKVDQYLSNSLSSNKKTMIIVLSDVETSFFTDYDLLRSTLIMHHRVVIQIVEIDNNVW